MRPPIDPPANATTSATVFGLDVCSHVPVCFLKGARAAPTGRPLEISSQPRSDDWPESVDLICNQKDLEGEVLFRIEAHPREGYLVSGPKHGAHLLSRDGRRLRCDGTGAVTEAWQRLVIAQALPFAALLQGLEVFHASAAALDGRAVALLGPSGAGKTSVVLELCRLGGDFLADDVVALEIDGDGLLAHAGTPLAGLDHGEAQRLQRAGHTPPQEVVAVNEREQLVRVRGAARPARLAALYFLDRRQDGPTTPHFEPVEDAQWLLSATFNFVFTEPERLRGLLEVCAAAARCDVQRILAGPRVHATELAEAVRRRMESAP
jgi:hypothetical protein